MHTQTHTQWVRESWAKNARSLKLAICLHLVQKLIKGRTTMPLSLLANKGPNHAATFPLASKVQGTSSKGPTFSFFVRSQHCEKRLSVLSCLSVCPHGTTRLPRDESSRNVISEDFFFENLSRIFKFNYNLTRLTSGLHEPPMYSHNISLNYCHNQKCFGPKVRSAPFPWATPALRVSRGIALLFLGPSAL